MRAISLERKRLEGKFEKALEKELLLQSEKHDAKTREAFDH